MGMGKTTAVGGIVEEEGGGGVVEVVDVEDTVGFASVGEGAGLSESGTFNRGSFTFESGSSDFFCLSSSNEANHRQLVEIRMSKFP
jgi:hypothetical protein